MANEHQTRVEELEHALRVAHRRIDELNTRALQAEGAAERASVESRLRVGFIEAGMKPDMVEFALADALNKGQWKTQSNGQLVRMVDPHTADVTTDGSFVTPAQWAKSLKAKAPSFFPERERPATQVAPSEAGETPNPWSAAGWNVTLQSKVMQTNMREAFRLAEAAGSSPYASSPPKAQQTGQQNGQPMSQLPTPRATLS